MTKVIGEGISFTASAFFHALVLKDSRFWKGKGEHIMPITSTELLGLFLNLVVLNAELDVLEDELAKEKV